MRVYVDSIEINGSIENRERKMNLNILKETRAFKINEFV